MDRLGNITVTDVRKPHIDLTFISGNKSVEN